MALKQLTIQDVNVQSSPAFMSVCPISQTFYQLLELKTSTVECDLSLLLQIVVISLLI